MSSIVTYTAPWKDELFKKISKQIKRGETGMVKRTLRKYFVDLIWFEDKKGRSLLHISTIYGKTKISRYLIKNGCSPNKQDAYNRCAVYLAALYRRPRHLDLFSTMKHK